MAKKYSLDSRLCVFTESEAQRATLMKGYNIGLSYSAICWKNYRLDKHCPDEINLSPSAVMTVWGGLLLTAFNQTFKSSLYHKLLLQYESTFCEFFACELQRASGQSTSPSPVCLNRNTFCTDVTSVKLSEDSDTPTAQSQTVTY